jgi:hypothetical protein
MSSGYSKRPLVEKLGIKSGARILFINSPQGYHEILGALPPKVTVMKRLGGKLDFIQFFTKQRIELEKRFPDLKGALSLDGAVWISWLKGKSKGETDLNENVVREIGLDNGLVDIKVCAVDETWSGLKFVYRVRDRKKGS